MLEATCDRGDLGNVNDEKKLEEWRCMTLLLTRVECVVDVLVLQTAWGTFAETHGARLALTVFPADAMQVVRHSGHVTFCAMHGPSFH